MKLIYSNGKVLTARDVSAPIFTLHADAPRCPLPIINEIMDEDTARARLVWLLATGHYRKGE